MSILSRKLGIDLGTANTLVYVPKKGIVINEPTIVAVRMPARQIVAIGQEAKDMLGRTPEEVIAIQPLKNGVIADYKVTEAFIKYFIDKVFGRFRIFRPEVMISVPGGITSTERRAVIEAAQGAGAKNAYVLKETVAAALGAGIPINSASGNLIIDIGGGTTDIAVLSLGGVVASNSIKIGGTKFDQSIASYVRRTYGAIIGEPSAEYVKKQIGSALPVSENELIEVTGRDSVSGMPKPVTITTNDIVEAIHEDLKEIIRAIREVLQNTPPELLSDIMGKGIVVTGGGALLRTIDDFISMHTSMPCFIADEPLLCVIKGIGISVDQLETYKEGILTTRN